jgi:hypothetical protein
MGLFSYFLNQRSPMPATQYSRDGRVQPRSRGVLDRPVKPGDDSLVVAGIFSSPQ